MFFRSCLSVLGLASLLSTAACFVPAEASEPTETSDDELRSFRDGELLGEIAVGETKTIEHSGTPKYRAFSFEVTEGDEIALSISAPGHDAVAWLLDASNRTIEKVNDFANEAAELVTYKASRSQRLSIVFRDANYEPATFTVSLKKNGAPFVTCSGTPALPTSGPRRLDVRSTFRYEYARHCDAAGVCSEWTLAQTLPTYAAPERFNAVLSVDGRYVSGALALRVPPANIPQACWAEDLVRPVMLDGNGHGSTTTLRQGERCDLTGGEDGSPYYRGEVREVDVVMGDDCLAVTEKTPTPRYGRQTKAVYLGTFER